MVIHDEIEGRDQRVLEVRWHPASEGASRVTIASKTLGAGTVAQIGSAPTSIETREILTHLPLNSVRGEGVVRNVFRQLERTFGRVTTLIQSCFRSLCFDVVPQLAIGDQQACEQS